MHRARRSSVQSLFLVISKLTPSPPQQTNKILELVFCAMRFCSAVLLAALTIAPVCAECIKVEYRQRVVGRCRRNNQIEVTSGINGGGWWRLAMEVNGGNRRRLATGGSSGGSGSGNCGGSGGRRLRRRQPAREVKEGAAAADKCANYPCTTAVKATTRKMFCARGRARLRSSGLTHWTIHKTT